MRKLIAIAGFFLSFWIFMSLPTPASAQALGNARLSLMQGDVAIQTTDTEAEWGAASVNTPLIPGTKLWVAENGKAEVQFLGGSYLRASENTAIDIADFKMDGQGNVLQVIVPQGRTYINYSGSNAWNSVFQVDSPITSTRAYGASKFKVDVYEDGYTEVSVISGDVSVESQNGNTRVDPGSMLSVGPDQMAELSPMRQADNWDQWNQSRDSALARAGMSRGYLPPTLGVYTNDFDTYGRWVSTPDYGYVWTPLRVGVDWSPYRIGRWCWIGGDYVWVSYEPWGWAPYHYGRWAFVGSIGWCWVPPHRTAVFWSPGFVAWISTPTYVSWVPLAPGEIYYGHGYYGPHSVNIRNVNINRINITNVYVNAKVVNAVTVVNRRTFITGRAERVADAPRNPFAAGVRPSIGRPDIKPERATAIPNPVKVVSEKQLPSREIVTKTAKMKDRPVATHKDASVFKPGERVRSMRVDRSERPKPVTDVQKRELRESPARRGEMGKAPVQGKELGPPPAQKGGPPVQREFGIAPPHKEEPGAPPQRKDEMKKPSAPSGATPETQQPSSAVPKREQMSTPPGQRKELGPPPAQKSPSGPSTQREFGIAPPQRGEQGTPPPRREEMKKPSAPSTATPQLQRPQSVAPKREQMVPPSQRREVAPTPAQKEQPGGPSTQREMGVAPQFKDGRGRPLNKPAPQRQMGPPSQPDGGTPVAPHGQKEEK